MTAPTDLNTRKVTINARHVFNGTQIPIENPTREQRLVAIASAAMLIQMEVLNDARNGQAELLLALMSGSDHTGTRLPDAMMSALTLLRHLANPEAPVKLDG